MQVVDSSTARRRAPTALTTTGTQLDDDRDTHEEDEDDEYDYEGGERKKRGSKDDKNWPTSGIGMEARIPETRKQFLKNGGGGGGEQQRENKWDKLIKQPNSKTTWVSFFSPLLLFLSLYKRNVKGEKRLFD
jgi:dolichyl-phosphate-mannose-protein mannosyltransferase